MILLVDHNITRSYEDIPNYPGIVYCRHRISVIWVNRQGYYIERVWSQVRDKQNIKDYYLRADCSKCE